MEHLLFAGYLIVFAWLVTKVAFFKRSCLTEAQLVILFLFKVLAGIFYGWVGAYYGNMAQMVDTWSYHYQSLNEANLLTTHPSQYLTHYFESGYRQGYAGFLGAENSWWNNLDDTVILKLFGIFNAVSFGHYYVNVIFYSFITLFGPIAFYRIFQDYFPGKRLQVLLSVFFIPSFLFWTSGLHKEGLLFNGVALIIYVFYFGWKEHCITWTRVLAGLISVLTLLALRNYILMMLLPALLTWAIARKLRRNPVLTFCSAYLFFALIFFAAPYISANLDFPGAVVDKQQQFLRLVGNSRVDVQPLHPTITSFIANAPQAFSLSILRPYFSDIGYLLSLAAALETNGLLLLFLVYLIWNWRRIRVDTFSLFCLFFSFSVLLVIGYTVNFLGAIVRYRSIVLPLLFVPVLVRIPWYQISHFFLNIIDNNNIDDLA